MVYQNPNAEAVYTVTVQVQYPFVAYTPLLGGLNGPITESTTYTY